MAGRVARRESVHSSGGCAMELLGQWQRNTCTTTLLEAEGGRWVCCGVGRVVAGHRFYGEMTEADGVPLRCSGCFGVVEA